MVELSVAESQKDGVDATFAPEIPNRSEESGMNSVMVDLDNCDGRDKMTH
jgi:hypothetical protein